MRYLYCLVCCLLAMAPDAFAQGWVKSYGTTGFEYGYNILPTQDGGFVALGTQTLSGDDKDLDFWIARFDSSGGYMWEKTYGTPGIEETLFGSNTTADGGFMFGGFTGKQFSGVESAHMFRTDADGNVKWEFDVNYALSDHFHSFTERKGGGYYFAGHTDSKGDPNGDMWLMRLGPNRDTLWNKVYDRGSSEHVHWMIETTDGNVVLLGHTAVNNREKYWVAKVDSNGAMLWNKVYGSGDSYHDSPYRVFETSNGNYAFIGGSSNATLPRGQMWLLVVDTAGTIVIDKHYGNATSDNFSQSGRQTYDGGFILAGYTNYQTSGSEDMYIVKTDPAGNLQWEKRFGGAGPDYGYDIEEFDDSYIAVGYTGSPSIMTGGNGDLMMVKIMKDIAPQAPVLLAPRNDSSNVPLDARLRWQGTSGATRYRVQVATDNGFTNIVLDDSSLTATSRALSSLQANTRYYWRIMASNSIGASPWSEVWSFTTRSPLALPGQVVLMSPLANAVVPNSSALLVWHPTGPEVDRYWVEYSTDQTFATSIIDSTVTDTSVTRTGLIDGTTYWWRVRGRNATGWGPYSEVRRFVVMYEAGVPLAGSYGVQLYQNLPNPFGTVTSIRFTLVDRAHVQLQVLDLLGRETALVLDEERAAGEYTEIFDGSALPSGTYLCRISVRAAEGTETVKTVQMVVSR